MLSALFLFCFLFAFGAIIGSFLNVVGIRYRSGLTLGGRSSCASCSRTLRWWELLPIASFLMQGGRCRTCRAKISLQYILVETLTGFVFASLFFTFTSLTEYVLAVLIFCVYIVILIYDFRHKIIPDPLVYLAIGLSLVFRFAAGGALLDWLMGPILFALFGLGWVISRGRALGFGDAKLVLSIGLFLGGAFGLSAVVLAFWIGAAVTLPLLFLSKIFLGKKLTIKSEVPFAPFLIMGALASLLLHLDLLYVLSF